MAGNLSPQARARLATLAEFSERVQRVYGLVEMYATTKANREQYLPAISRGFSDLRFKFMGVGMDDLAQLAAAMTLAAKRGVSHTAKIRILRDGVGSMRFQLEMEQRAVIAEDEAERNRANEQGEPPAFGARAAVPVARTVQKAPESERELVDEVEVPVVEDASGAAQHTVSDEDELQLDDFR